MQIKPGSVGYFRTKNGWSKCVVLGHAGVALWIRIAPKLKARSVHVEEFLPEQKFRALGYRSNISDSISEKIRTAIECKLHYLQDRQKKRNGKIPIEFKARLFAGCVGWAKVRTKGTFYRKKWRRCFVLKQENTDLTLCCCPDLSLAIIDEADFIPGSLEPCIRIAKPARLA